MQVRAIFEAAAEVQKKGIKVKPEVMIPLVGFPKELKLQIEIVHRVAAEVAKERKTRFNYLVGTMIEIPRERQSLPIKSRKTRSSLVSVRTI